MLLRTYESILSGLPDPAIVDAAKRFTSGLVPDQNTEFAPSVATFTTEVRRIASDWQEAERARLRPPPPALKPVSHPIASIKARAELDMAGRRVLADGVTMDEFRAGAQQRRWPAGAVYVAVLGMVFAPMVERNAEAA